MSSSRPSPRSQSSGSSSRLPAIVVNPAPGTSEDVYDVPPNGSARPANSTEQIAAFLEALAATMRDDVQRRGPTAPSGNGASDQPATGLGAPQSAEYEHYGSESGAMPSPALYHLLRALRNLNHFVFITPGPRGLLFVAHIPRKILVLILFALFLMFASVYRLPEVWEILFGIFGIF
ncbi:MAG: hypothetical protein GX613_00245 [Chloroflexi bacterium]|nr:hypothetical protein [Chloroflexota bacterium]